MKDALIRSDLVSLVDIVERGWQAKVRTSPGVTNPTIEAIRSTALDAGALTGKVSGAGGGGFAWFIIDPPRRPDLLRALSSIGVGAVDHCHFTKEGVVAWNVS